MTTDIHALAGAYALDAVDDLERAAFDRHLRECETCAVEIAEFRETTARLADATATTPPPAMRASVMAAVAGTPQVRAATTRDAGSARRWRRWVAASAAAAVLAVGSAAATWSISEQRVRETQSQAAEIDAVLSAPDARLVSTDMAGGRVSVVVSPSRDQGVVVLKDLASPGDDRIYQMWVIRGSAAAAPVGAFPSGQGDGRAVITGWAGVDTFAISNEKAGPTVATPSVVVGKVAFG